MDRFPLRGGNLRPVESLVRSVLLTHMWQVVAYDCKFCPVYLHIGFWLLSVGDCWNQDCVRECLYEDMQIRWIISSNILSFAKLLHHNSSATNCTLIKHVELSISMSTEFREEKRSGSVLFHISLNLCGNRTSFNAPFPSDLVMGSTVCQDWAITVAVVFFHGLPKDPHCYCQCPTPYYYSWIPNRSQCLRFHSGS